MVQPAADIERSPTVLVEGLTHLCTAGAFDEPNLHGGRGDCIASDVDAMGTARLRRTFLVDDSLAPGARRRPHTHVDRRIVGTEPVHRRADLGASGWLDGDRHRLGEPAAPTSPRKDGSCI